MKLFVAFAALATALTVQAQSSECAGASKSLAAYDRPFVAPLFEACRDELGTSVNARQNPWVNKHCVAAAIAANVSASHSLIPARLLITTYA